jgi:hypothetical protein
MKFLGNAQYVKRKRLIYDQKDIDGRIPVYAALVSLCMCMKSHFAYAAS